MSDNINWLITILYGNTLLRCALQVDRKTLTGDCAEYPMEPENRRAIHKLLPTHVQSCGPIVAIDELFAIHVANEGTIDHSDKQKVLKDACLEKRWPVWMQHIRPCVEV